LLFTLYVIGGQTPFLPCIVAVIVASGEAGGERVVCAGLRGRNGPAWCFKLVRSLPETRQYDPLFSASVRELVFIAVSLIIVSTSPRFSAPNPRARPQRMARRHPQQHRQRCDLRRPQGLIEYMNPLATPSPAGAAKALAARSPKSSKTIRPIPNPNARPPDPARPVNAQSTPGRSF